MVASGSGIKDRGDGAQPRSEGRREERAVGQGFRESDLCREHVGPVEQRDRPAPRLLAFGSPVLRQRDPSLDETVDRVHERAPLGAARPCRSEQAPDGERDVRRDVGVVEDDGDDADGEGVRGPPLVRQGHQYASNATDIGRQPASNALALLHREYAEARRTVPL